MKFQTFDPSTTSVKELYFLLTSLVVPRPIAWISTVDRSGHRNLAPHSYFNVCSQDPPVVHFTQGALKDSARNAMETGEFVVNMVHADQLAPMNETAANFPPEEDEFAWANVDAVPSHVVNPERVAGSRAALECTVRDVLRIGASYMIFGDVVRLHIADDVIDDGRVDPGALAPLGRLGGSNYAIANTIVRAVRPTWDQIQAAKNHGSSGDVS